MRRQMAWLTLATFVWANIGSAFAQTVAPLIWGVNSGGAIYRWTGSAWEQMPGGLKNVAVGSDGTVWGVNQAGVIWRWTGTAWQQMPGGLAQISVGSAQHVWGVNANNDIWRWTGSGWQQVPGKLSNVAVASDGTVWGVNASGIVHRWMGQNWQAVPGSLSQISVGSAQHVWGVDASNDVWRWTGSGWQQLPGKLSNVAVASDGTAWGVNPGGIVHRWVGQNWQAVPGGLAQISVAAPASAASPSVVITPPTVMNIPASPSQGVVVSQPTTITGGAPQNIGVTPQIPGGPSGQAGTTTGSLTVSGAPLSSSGLSSQPLNVTGPKWQPSSVPPASGSIECSRGSVNSCGTTKADYVGAYALNMKCESGFYDPIYGGTCWKCPDDTDEGGKWLRSATAITADDACWRVPKEKTGQATRVKGPPAAAWDCSSGTFWDGYPLGGACWQCPDDHPRRTAAAVWANNACATPINQTRQAVFVTFNGCPKPDAAKMGLAGKRLPGKPFLDIAGGWNQGVAAGGCYTCPVTAENGNILITDRNAAPIYGNNAGCDILFEWRPVPFPEPGMSGLSGVREAILGSNLLDSNGLTAGLYILAEARGMAKDTPAAQNWVTAQWGEIAAGPYKNEAFRTLVYMRLLLAAGSPAADRTPGDTQLISAFEAYINARRVHMAQTGLAMYDAWKANDDRIKQNYARSQLMVMFDYGTVPFDFHSTVGATMAVSATGAGMIGAIVAAEKIASSANWVQVWSKQAQAMVWTATRSTTLYGTLGTMRALDVLKFANLTANIAMIGAAVISVVGIILQSIAMDQFLAIISARPKLEAALAQAQQPVTLSQVLSEPNGRDQAVYYWSKAMDVSSEREDGQVVAMAASAQQKAQANGYRLQVAGSR